MSKKKTKLNQKLNQSSKIKNDKKISRPQTKDKEEKNNLNKNKKNYYEKKQNKIEEQNIAKTNKTNKEKKKIKQNNQTKKNLVSIEKEIEKKVIVKKELPKKEITEKKQPQKETETLKNIQKRKNKKDITKYILISIILLIIVVTVFIFNKPEEGKEIYKYDEYKIGTAVVLNNDTKWYVIEDSPKSEESILLLSEKILDLNDDDKRNSKDKIEFSSDGSFEYDVENKKNIAYYLNNTYKKSLENIEDLYDVRLITSEEYVNIRDTLGYDYEWKEGNWLASEKLGKWWTSSSKNKKIMVVGEKGSYVLASSTKKYNVRPVIKISKSNIKEILANEEK